MDSGSDVSEAESDLRLMGSAVRFQQELKNLFERLRGL